MITSKQLAAYLQGKLGFTIFTDYGRYVAAQRDHNNVIAPVCGIFRLDPISVVPVQGVFVASGSASIEVAADPKNLDMVRSIVDGLTQYSGETVTIEDDDGTNYAVTFTYTSANVGVERPSPTNIGKVIPVSFTAYLNIIENGVASSSVKISIDGSPLLFSEVIVTHQRVGDTYATDDGIARSAIVQGGRSFDFIANE